MYRSLAGIAPAAPGYARVSIHPEVSKNEGPDGVNSSVATVRGTVSSRWSRVPEADGCVLTLTVTVPVGMTGDVLVPMMTSIAEDVTVTEVSPRH